MKSSDESLNSLVKKRFNIVSVARLSDESDWQYSRWEEAFILQKAGSVYKCFEEQYPRSLGGAMLAFLMAAARPYFCHIKK
ncbi:MAG TPA: hypothetical protein DIW64_00765 [Cellvibrio sp.]|nr:hypothetical protein [Cellvibrio sp.]